MAEIVLAASSGRATGTSAARRLRASGMIPAVLYGRGREAAALAVDWRELRAVLTTDKGLNALLTLQLDGRRAQAVVKELQRHPVRRDVLHIDFLEVDPEELLTTDVPIHLEGEAEKVTRDQGIVEQVLNALVVEGKPAAIPGHISVDVSDMEIGHTITVADLALPEGVTTEADPEQAVVTAQITSLALAEEEEEAEGEEVEGEEAEAAAGEGGEGQPQARGGEAEGGE